MSALKVQTAPGVWAVVGGQAPGLDQAAADLRYVKLAGDTMTGPLIVNAAFSVNAGGDSPATMCRIYHNTQPMVALYAGGAVNARLSTRLNGPVTLEAVNAAGVELSVGAVSYLTVTPTAITMVPPLLSKAAGTFKQTVSLWNAAQASTSLGFFNQATDEATIGARLGYIGSNTGTADIYLCNETGLALTLRASSATGVMRFYTGGTAAANLHLFLPTAGGARVCGVGETLQLTTPFVAAGGGPRIAFYDGANPEALGALHGYVGVNGADMYVSNMKAGSNLWLSAKGMMDFSTNSKNYFRLTTTGEFLSGGQAGNANNYSTKPGFQIRQDGRYLSTSELANVYNWAIHLEAADAASVPFYTFRRAQVPTTPTQIGSITQVATTGVAYNTASHGPYKGNVVDVDDDVALARIESWRPVEFQWKLGPDGSLREDGTPTGDVQVGFLAQELALVAPEAVTPGFGTEAEWDAWSARSMQARDAAEPFSEDEPFLPWMTDTSRLVPSLVAAVRALIHKVAALEGAA